MNLEDDIRFTLGQIDGKVDLLLEQGRIQDDRTIALESRVRTVEGRQHWYAGVAAGISALVTAVGGHWLKGWFGGHG